MTAITTQFFMIDIQTSTTTGEKHTLLKDFLRTRNQTTLPHRQKHENPRESSRHTISDTMSIVITVRHVHVNRAAGQSATLALYSTVLECVSIIYLHRRTSAILVTGI
jgi:hypothetical protein